MFSKTTFANMPKILLFTSGLTLEELAVIWVEVACTGRKPSIFVLLAQQSSSERPPVQCRDTLEPGFFKMRFCAAPSSCIGGVWGF